jgi:hypothetical protein
MLHNNFNVILVTRATIDDLNPTSHKTPTGLSPIGWTFSMRGSRALILNQILMR